MATRATLPFIRSAATYPVSVAKYLVGISSTSTRGQTTAQSLATTESYAGHQSIHRDYANDTYTNFMISQRSVDVDTVNHVSIRTTHVSWNPDALLLQSENPPNSTTHFSGFDPTQLQLYLADGSGDLTSYGAETQKNIQWLLTIPTYHKVILNPWHEADNYQADRTYGTNYGAFRNGFRIIADIIHAFNNANWQTCLLLTAYAWKYSSGSANHPSNFFPAWSGLPATGANYVDIMGVDVYNEGSVNGSHWDSPSGSIGIPMDANEQTGYKARYGGTYGWKTSDASTLTWTNGFLGWCEAFGMTKWLVGEIGTQRNINNLTASWTSLIGATNSKTDWIREFGRFASAYSADPSHKAKCYALEYFMSAGRTYTGSNYLTTSIHDSSSGALITGITGSVASSTNLPTNLTSSDTGVRYITTDTRDIWQWSGSAWSDVISKSLSESWQLWWNDDGSGWDGTGSAYYGWLDVTSRYGI